MLITDSEIETSNPESQYESISHKHSEVGIGPRSPGGDYHAKHSHIGVPRRLNKPCYLPKPNWISSVSDGSITVVLLEFNFNSIGVGQGFVSQVVESIRHLAGKVIDQGSDIGCSLTQESLTNQVSKACENNILDKNNWQHIPDKQRFVFNPAIMQSETGGHFV